MTDDDRADGGEEVRVDAGGDVEEAAPEDVAPDRPSLNREQLREEVTHLVEAAAQSGIPADDVADVLRERADAAEVLYEGMQRYGRRPDGNDA